MRTIDQRDIKAADESTYPEKGDQVVTRATRGYIYPQRRDLNCQPVCTCGACDGHEVVETKTVTQVVFWMDNSTEAYFTDGTKLMLEYPHGDACY